MVLPPTSACTAPTRVDETGLLDGLSPVQRRAVTAAASPLCIVASAGAGKTRVLTRRIAFRVATGDAAPDHVLAITFTRKAAGELRDRLRRLGLRDSVTAGTFHAVAAASLRRWWADRGQRPATVLDRKGRLLGPLAAARPALARVPLGELAGHIDWAQARLVPPSAFEDAARDAGRALPAPAADLAALYARYEDEKVRRGLVDFDDLLKRCAEALERDPLFAGAERWRWRHLFVDEFQDVNPLQHRLLEAWLGPSRDLCVVGDPDQAIYGWNGADPSLLDRFGERWPGAEVVRLDDNHRCTPQIVAAATAVLGARAGLRSTRPDGPPPEVRRYRSEEAEAAGVAAAVGRAHAEGTPWSAMAVLARTNAQLVPLRGALERVGIPVRALGADRATGHPAARQILDALRRQPQQPMAMVAADLAAAADEGDDDRRAALGVLAQLAQDFRVLDPAGTVEGWLVWLPSALGPERAPAAGDGVTVCSFHRAKGLEWEAVWVTGLEDGLVPLGRAGAPGAEDEERRLLYVALTRAGRSLHCSWAERRTFGSHPVPRRPSPWLGRFPASTEAGEAGDPAGAWRERLREQREELRLRGRHGPRLPDGWPPPDPALLGALRAWRTTASRASGVPAHVILHDSALAAIAALRPQTVDSLLEVPGLGPVKAGRYGPALLALVAERAATA